LPTHVTLALDDAATAEAKKRAAAQPADVYVTYEKDSLLVPGGKQLTPDEISLLELEHQQYLHQLSSPQRMQFSLAEFGMFVALLTLCGVYVSRYEPKLLR